MELRWHYKALGKFTYHVLSDDLVKAYLLRFIVPEWERDRAEYPTQQWTRDWLARLPRLTFRTERLRLSEVRPRVDLMSYATPTYSFARELADRAVEREESMLRGASVEPLLVFAAGHELMDGYTRYQVLTKHGEPETFAYVGYDA